MIGVAMGALVAGRGGDCHAVRLGSGTAMGTAVGGIVCCCCCGGGTGCCNGGAMTGRDGTIIVCCCCCRPLTVDLTTMGVECFDGGGVGGMIFPSGPTDIEFCGVAGAGLGILRGMCGNFIC